MIREVYDNDNAQEIFQLELERAVQTGCATIIIEPSDLGEETERWISTGFYLHKTSILFGIGSLAAGKNGLFSSVIGDETLIIIVGIYWSEKRFASLPMSLTSCLCASLYTACWSFDPCSSYTVPLFSCYQVQKWFHNVMNCRLRKDPDRKRVPERGKLAPRPGRAWRHLRWFWFVESRQHFQTASTPLSRPLPSPWAWWKYRPPHECANPNHILFLFVRGLHQYKNECFTSGKNKLIWNGAHKCWIWIWIF